MEKVILFQGDSITDCGRSRELDRAMGNGYATFVGGALGAKEPYQYKFYNRGISGNRVVDLYARIKSDCWNHTPDIISVLIGVNDVWHEAVRQNGVDARRFENMYRTLVEDTMQALPGVKMILLEPFILPGAANDGNWEYFRDEVAIRGAITKKIAEEFRLPFLPLQERFEKAAEQTGNPALWLGDGVHPTPAGHKMISDAWVALAKENGLL